MKITFLGTLNPSDKNHWENNPVTPPSPRISKYHPHYEGGNLRILLRGRVIFYFHVFHEFLCTVRPWGILRTPDCIPLEYRPSLGSHNNLELILQLQPFCPRRNSSRNQSKSGGQGRWFQPLFQLPEALTPISNNILGQDKNLNTFWTLLRRLSNSDRP